MAGHSLSLVVGSRGYSLAEVYGLLIVAAFPAAEHRLYSVKAWLWLVGSVVTARGPQSAGSVVWGTGLVALQHVESSQTWDRNHVPCIGRWILNHWTPGKSNITFLFFGRGSPVLLLK